MSHTPGPWRAKRCEDRDPDSNRCDGIVPAYHNHDGPNCFDWDRPGYETCPATLDIVTTDSGFYGPTWDDACLIAAAPELYDALKALMEEIYGVSEIAETVRDMARNAIAKAEGR